MGSSKAFYVSVDGPRGCGKSTITEGLKLMAEGVGLQPAMFIDGGFVSGIVAGVLAGERDSTLHMERLHAWMEQERKLLDFGMLAYVFIDTVPTSAHGSQGQGTQVVSEYGLEVHSFRALMLERAIVAPVVRADNGTPDERPDLRDVCSSIAMQLADVTGMVFDLERVPRRANDALREALRKVLRLDAREAVHGQRG